MTNSKAYAAHNPTSPLVPYLIQRRDPGPSEVEIDILYCGVCHSDLHQARNEWASTLYPCVPGHEIVGRVNRTGTHVSRFQPGDLAAIGCMVDACGNCPSCVNGEEQFCEQGPTFTYNSEDRHGGGMTYGGYSRRIVADEAFVLRVPEGLDPAGTAPLLCAGITTYSPLRRWNIGPGQTVGVVGLGGLGHMAVKFAKALGAHVVLFTTSPGKAEDARRLGAAEVVITREPDAFTRHANRFDFILDTVSAPHDLNVYLSLLKVSGTLCLVGVPPEALPVHSFNLVFGRRQLAGSLIGGIRETQEMLEFCGKHRITSDIELIAIADINEAYERLLKNEVKYRFVIDMATL
ncbi:MAG: NAD(P)-dependent alcohol dehydrogenase [Methylococcus sp.]